MAAEGLSAAERQAELAQRLDQIDRALLGLLPRAERLAVVANVESRLQALGDEVPLTREPAFETTAAATAAVSTRPSGRRSRLAYSAGVLGIVTAACLVVSPVLLLGVSIFAELLGETFAILLFAALAVVVGLGGAFAVFGGGASLFRLARRGQSSTGLGWAITGICTGALPLLMGIAGVFALLASVMPAESVQVTYSNTPANAVPCAVPGGCPLPMQVPMLAPSYGPAGPVYAAPDAPYGYAVPPGSIQPPPQPMPVQVAAQPRQDPAPPAKPWSEPKVPAKPEPNEPEAERKAEPMNESKPEKESEFTPEDKPKLTERPVFPFAEPNGADH